MLATHYTLPDGEGIDVQGQVDTGAGNTEQLLTPPKGASAIMVCCIAVTGYLSFDGDAASATNGLAIIAGAQPVLIPVRLHEGEQLRWAGSAANAKLNYLWLADS